MSAQEPQTGQTLSLLAHYGFSDLELSIKNLDELSAILPELLPDLAPFQKVSNPDQALSFLVELAKLDQEVVYRICLNQNIFLRLVKLAGASQALAEFLKRHPESLAVFEGEPSLPTFTQMQQSLDFAKHEKVEQTSQQLRAIRIAYRQILLAIAIWDLTQPDPIVGLAKVTKALSEAASVALDAGLLLARRELVTSTTFGKFDETEVENTRLAVIGMGKGGAGELNYVSDVDVIFVAESNSESLSKERMLDIATKLATRMMRAMDQPDIEPALWQVDANLRPEGKSGALVRTLESHLAYYDKWAENWEFQALLKANPIAGDLELGGQYKAAVEPLVWASSKRDNFVESVQQMRKRVSENIPAEESDRQIKLGPGGLRDVEFTVQLLQLVHGRSDNSVRAPDTLTAIEQLVQGGYIGRQDGQEFANHYGFLRVLEHRIQLINLRRTHLMPAESSALRSVARSLVSNWSEKDLLEKWQEVKLQVRQLHQRIFYKPLLSAVAAADGGLVLQSEQITDRLAAIGFANPLGAIQHIQALTSGLSRRAQIQRQLLPVLLEWFGRGTDPDTALVSFRRLSENLGESHWYLRMLRDSSGAAERLTTALSNSRLATQMLEINPEAAAWLEESQSLQPRTRADLDMESASIAGRHQELEQFAQIIRSIRRRETLRLALGAILDEFDFLVLAKGLTDLTEWYLSSLAEKVVARSDAASLIDFGMVAMGRFGGGELSFGSDADVMFIYDVAAGVDRDLAQKTAEQVISEIRKLARDNQLDFEIDLDLRPEGKNGAIARSIDSYAAYYSRWGDLWENQALLRARMIFGSAQLRNGFDHLVDCYRYPEQFSAGDIMEIRRIKARVENERLPQGSDPKRHLKLGRGSLSDIEWLVQLFQLQHGKAHPTIRTSHTLIALNRLVDEKLIEAHDARVLEEAWNFCSRVRSAMVLWAGKKNDILPIDRKQLEAISRLLGYSSGAASEFEQDYLAKTRRARMVFERLFFA
ncbi:MAG: bifunctional [glutamine synthetase] adenylyltransferase/[glutamine synthetase]-adenylyl-L-tyrosine phosphorylase [Actinobacteria bacterium]|nr:bifunctional [glutamine synthetase] adenylyltransferase/[glutamine synthetase]-adenylyl-L-tyrosine phosphorylase [Actinomycetota bacterium]